ncbi:MAG: DUF3109 family protein [bacterium]
MNKDFIEIDDILVDKELANTKFTCDLEKCKGACCTMVSDFGAPLLEDEIPKIEKVLSNVLKYLSPVHQKEIESYGFWEKKSGELMTRSINRRECVFVFYEKDIAKCAIEKAYRNGESEFIKPVSCHLFPIRVKEFGGKILRYEKYSDCSPALIKGKKTKLNILDFCHEPLLRAFGENWFNKLKSVIGK